VGLVYLEYSDNVWEKRWGDAKLIRVSICAYGLSLLFDPTLPCVSLMDVYTIYAANGDNNWVKCDNDWYIFVTGASVFREK
jgi:hypothetical protein